MRPQADDVLLSSSLLLQHAPLLSPVRPIIPTALECDASSVLLPHAPLPSPVRPIIPTASECYDAVMTRPYAMLARWLGNDGEVMARGCC